MGKILCTDGIELDWPYPCAPTTSLSSEVLIALQDPEATTRALAAAPIDSTKARSLYRGPHWSTFNTLRSIGRKLQSFGLEEFAKGSTFTTLKKVLSASTRMQAIEILTAAHL